MYKLFLCLRYLRSRIIAYFAVLAVALCVAMMLIAVSVMTGFLDKIENAAKGLFGDVVVSGESLSGLGRYDEFISELKQKVPEVEAASPFILTFGILSIPDQDYRQTIQIAGIRLPERATVTAFEDGLFAQAGMKSPTFDPPIDLLLRRLTEHGQELKRIYHREIGQDYPVDLPGNKADMQRRLRTAEIMQGDAAEVLLRARPHQRELSELQDKLRAAEAKARGEYSEEAEELSEQLDALVERTGYQGPANRVILGLGIPGLVMRTDEGETVRYIVPGHQVILSLVPLGRKVGTMDVPLKKMRLTVVDDCRTDVSSIDSDIAYLPFDTLQRMNQMDVEYDPADPSVQVVPARCSQIHIKVPDEFNGPAKVREVAQKVQAVWNDFHKRYPDAAGLGDEVRAEPWRVRQAKIIGPIQQQRTLVVIMFGIISLVSVVLIFVIFYTIVVQKTRDIGVMKAIGASSEGVAGIFLGWGATVGLIGAILGCIGGYYFVKHINPIQDAIDEWFGFRVWSREWYLFEEIPNEVDPQTGLVIAISAIVAGLLGALIPAIRAGRMQPVEALRYE